MTQTTEPDMSDDDKRRDQLLRAEHSTEADAAPRIVMSHGEHGDRIDIAETAAVRPGPGPGMGEDAEPGSDGSRRGPGDDE